MNKQKIEPTMFNDIFFENDEILIKKTCFWQNCSLWKDDETNLLKVNLPGSQAFNIGCIATFAYPDGRRATEQEFCYLGSFHEGLAKVAVAEGKYGFVDANMEFIIQPIYNYVRDFQNGYAIVSRRDEENKTDITLFIDKLGKEFVFERIDNYNSISDYSDGMFMVSDLKSCGIYERWVNLAYFSDYYDNAGFWGYTDNTGKEVIKPQYIYAFDFENGLALVCKGKWTKDKKWDNKYNTGRYWTEEELWGVIDKTGKEVVSCKFDEIKSFSYDGAFDNCHQYLKAHYGGWKEGKWGIINYSGEWIVEPIFGDIGYDISNDDCFTFYNEDKWSDPDDVPMGIYSISECKVLFEPQFLDVDFLGDGNYKVEIYNEKLNRKIEQIIDKNGRAIFVSNYTYLFDRKDGYETMIREKDGKQIYGFVDKVGNEILPCKFEISWDGLLIDIQRIIFKKNGKCGLMTFDEKIIIQSQYTSLRNIRNEFLEAKIGGKEGQIDEGRIGLLTLNGINILPIVYKSISIENDTIIARSDEGTTLFHITSVQNRNSFYHMNSC
ncbi:MAG: WG repeat-containing protein [Dysgonamonadaceae bacterium]|jgi:hypothetical protein|nr:WG repeat-containing protein [Dysgonamonadaceae bacterium]